MLLLIDNYDSFVYNLGRYLGRLGRSREVVRNDAIDLAAVRAMQPEGIILSPGPCTPDQAGICLPLVQELGASIPILGVCLGHQCIGQVYGGHIRRANRPVHGQTSLIQHDGRGLFSLLPAPLQVARYHSLIVDCADAGDLQVSAWSEEHEVMAVRHKGYPVFGVQFHPESVLMPRGMALMRNFLRLMDQWNQTRRRSLD